MRMQHKTIYIYFWCYMSHNFLVINYLNVTVHLIKNTMVILKKNTHTHTCYFNSHFGGVNLGWPVAPLILRLQSSLSLTASLDRPTMPVRLLTRSGYASPTYINSWPTFSPYLYNRVYSELTCCNSLAWLVHAGVDTCSHPSVFISHYNGRELS